MEIFITPSIRIHYSNIEKLPKVSTLNFQQVVSFSLYHNQMWSNHNWSCENVRLDLCWYSSWSFSSLVAIRFGEFNFSSVLAIERFALKWSANFENLFEKIEFSWINVEDFNSMPLAKLFRFPACREQSKVL